MFVRVHPNDPDIVFIGSLNVFRSFDGFATPVAQFNDGWIAGYDPNNDVSLYSNHHPDQHSFEFFPSDPDRVISGHDGGLSITDDVLASAATGPEGIEPVAWTSLNNGYLTTQVYALSIGPDEQLMAGFQDNSTWFTSDTVLVNDWTDLFSGDGSYNAFAGDGSIRYVSSQLGNVFRLEYAGPNSTALTGFQDIDPAGAAGALFVAPFELDPNDDNIMYFAAGNTVWRNDDLLNATNTVGWTQLTNSAVAGSVSAIGISRFPANVVYIGSTTGDLMRIDGANVGNPTGVSVNSGLPGGSNVTSIDVDDEDPNHVIATFSNYSILSIFETFDGGNNWTAVSGNLEENPDGSGSGPSVRWTSIIGDNDFYLTGTSTGLYRADVLNGASTVWTQVEPDFIGQAVVEQIRTRDDGLVAIGTHGNGLFSANFEVSEISEPAILPGAPVGTIAVLQNSADTTIDVSTAFISTLDPPETITVVSAVSSDTSIVTTSLNGNLLTLSFVPGVSGFATINLTGEDGLSNQAMTSFNVEVEPIIDTFPFVETFADANLPDGFSTDGTFPWIVNSGGTPSAGTGPLGDNTEVDGSGFYIYTEATGGTPGDVGELSTPFFDLSATTTPGLSFAYHMFGINIGSLEVDVLNTAGNSLTTVFSVTGAQQLNQDDPYLLANVDLAAFAGETIQILFRATRGLDFESDIAIDDILISEDIPLLISDPIEDVAVLQGSADIDIDISNAFASNPPETLTFAVASSDTSVVTTSISGTTLTLSFNPASSGLANITVTAFNSASDSTSQSFQAFVQGVVNSFPFVETFESLALPDGFTVSGIFPWTVNSGGTPSAGTGPLGDNTEPDGSGFYIHTEATGGTTGDVGELTSPILNLGSLNTPTLQFFYHLFGVNQGTLEVDILDFADTTQTTVFTVTGQQQADQGDPYLPAVIDLSAFQGSSIQIIFRGIRGPDFESDIALDDISIFSLPDNDVFVSNVIVDPIVEVDSDQNLTIEIVNFGAQSQSGFDVGFVLDSTTSFGETFTGTIASGDTASFTFSNPLPIPNSGEFEILAFTALTGDENTANDTTAISILALDRVTLPYNESFENGNGGWFAMGANSSWELGEPADALIDSASDCTQAWVTNLDGDYNNNEQSFVISPIFDLSGNEGAFFSADIFFEIEGGFDGTSFQASTDFGQTWMNIGELGDSINWFNDNTGSLGFSGGNGDAWSGELGDGSEGYINALHALDGLGGDSTVILRFVLGTDGSVTNEGFAFDNVSVVDGDSILSITCPDDITANTDPGEAFATVSIPVPTFTNNLGSTSTLINDFTGTEDASGEYPVGMTTVTYSLTDSLSGLQASCSFTVEVIDDEPPVLILPNDTTVITMEDSIIVTYPDPIVMDNVPATFSQLGRQQVVPLNSFACSAGLVHADNSYVRVYDVAEGFQLENVDFGIELATPGAGFTTQQVIVRSYSVDPSQVVDIPNFTLLEQDTLDIPDLVDTVLNVVLGGTPLPGEQLAIEIFTPDAFFSGLGHSFLLGSDTIPETGTSYWNGPDCGTVALAPSSVIAPDVHWILDIEGSVPPELISGIGSGGLFPQGINVERYQATDLAGNITEAEFSVIIATEQLDAPINLAVTSRSDSSLTIAFDSVAGAESYLVDVSVDGFVSFVDQGLELSDTTGVIMNLDANTAYDIRVAATNTSGGFSEFSDPLVGELTSPAVPMILASGISGDGFTIDIVSNDGVTDFEIDISSDEFTTFVVEDSIISSNTFMISELTSGTIFDVRVRGVNAAGTGIYTMPIQVATLPGMPTITVSDLTFESFVINVATDDPDTDSFEIDVSTDNFATFVLDSEVFTGNAVSITGLEMTTLYNVRVRGVNASGNGIYSDTLDVTTPEDPILGIGDELDLEITLYPNPTSGLVTLDLGERIGEVLQGAIFNVQGKVVMEFDVPVQTRELRLDVTNLKSGIYLIKLEDDQAGKTFRLIRE